MTRRITVQDLEDRLAAFEYQHGMTTAEFLVKWQRGEMATDEQGLEPWDYIDWAIIARALEQTTKA